MFEGLGGVACFGGKLGEIAGGVQFEQARCLFARSGDGALETPPGLIVMPLRLPKAAAKTADFCKVQFLVYRFGQVFGFIEVRTGLFELVRAQLIFGELRQIAR